MDIVYIWKQKKYKQTKNKWEAEKFTSQFTYYLDIHLQNTVSHTKKNEI